MTNWKLYWGVLFTSLFALGLWQNSREYPQKSRTWRAGKSLLDASIVALLAAFCPPLLIAYCVLWVTRKIPGDAVIKTTASVLAGLSFAAIGGFFLEVILVVGVYAVDLLTGKFFRSWDARAE